MTDVGKQMVFNLIIQTTYEPWKKTFCIWKVTIDEDNESDLTFERVDQWVKQLKTEIKEIRFNSKNLEIV